MSLGSPLSPVDVVNICLAQSGIQAQVTSINPSDGSTAADAASILWTTKVQSLLRAAHWNCARAQVNLTLLKAALGTPENPSGSLPQPPQPWTYEYAYPSDCLKARYIPALSPQPTGSTPIFPIATGPLWPPYVPTEGVRFQVGTDFDAANRRVRCIFTGWQQAQLVYTADLSQNVSLWDPHFIEAAAAYLGPWLVNALARNRGLFQDTAGIAKEMITAARVSDGNEGLTSADHMPDWMAIRSGLPGWYNGFYYGWDAISFPDGSTL